MIQFVRLSVLDSCCHCSTSRVIFVESGRNFCVIILMYFTTLSSVIVVFVVLCQQHRSVNTSRIMQLCHKEGAHAGAI